MHSIRKFFVALALGGTVLTTGSAAHADPLLPTATAEWDGSPVYLRPAGLLPDNLSIHSLSDALWVGTATNFQTADPSFACLNGSELQVYAASSTTLDESGLLTFHLSDIDPCSPDFATFTLTWVAEPSRFYVEKATRLVLQTASEDGDNEGHAPRIDLYLTDGYGAYAPCTREVLPNNSKKYVCRKINYTTTVIPTVSPSILATVAVDYGEASGGIGRRRPQPLHQGTPSVRRL